MAREARVPVVATVGKGKHQPWKQQQQIAPSMDVTTGVSMSYTVCFSFHMEIAERVSLINNEYLSIPIKLHQNWMDIL